MTKKKNLIFMCVFLRRGYVTLLNHLLYSIRVYGGVGDNTDIWIYTTAAFQPWIMTQGLPVYFVTSETKTTLDAACRARLDVLELPGVAQYDRILYLDTDILVVGELQPLWNLCVASDRVYALEEGTMADHDPVWDYYGRTLFSESERGLYKHRTAFSSGILLFQNSEAIRSLFEKIKEDMAARPICRFDQPYLVHHAMREGMMDNRAMRGWAILYPPSWEGWTWTFLGIMWAWDRGPRVRVIHFAGGVGVHAHKERFMRRFLTWYDWFGGDQKSFLKYNKQTNNHGWHHDVFRGWASPSW